MAAERPNRPRCAIYTRKSSEEGLDKSFNSLDAQREACEAYIKSQAGEGWRLIRTRFDDAGLSGGTMDRPALQALLGEIHAGRVDTVVVYKVDRLTRSLTDFAKIIDVFGAHGASFVSVTQEFNTTTSMGRLTLNMLLSFAQFEREVTGERIRDKIAASKRKGMWMGGFVPLGYDAKDRALVINDEEAETVRTVFRLYLEYGNVRCVKEAADRLGLTTKIRTAQNGRMRGGRPLSRGYIYKLLGNPLYAGRIAHKGEEHEGQHEPIVDAETWDAVQAILTGNATERRLGPKTANPSLLVGLVHDEHGNRLTPSHAVKSGRRYRYYVSRSLITGARSDPNSDGIRIPAHELEGLVIETLRSLLLDRPRLFGLLELHRRSPRETERALALAKQTAPALNNRDAVATIRMLLERVTVREDEVQVIVAIIGIGNVLGLTTVPDTQAMPQHHAGQLCIKVPTRIARCGGAKRIIIADDELDGERGPDPALVKLLSRAHDWFEKLINGTVTSAADIARDDGLTRSYVTRVLRLAFLAPDISEAILNGRQPLELNAERLSRSSRLPLDWDDQRRLLGFPKR